MQNTYPMDSKDFLTHQAYQYCEDYTQQHTEHFPVTSLLLPKELRRSIAVIYTFARQADDIADENDYNPIERLKQLETYEKAILQLPKVHNHDASFYAENYRQTNMLFIALHDLIQHYPLLKPELFLDLLSAFKQDILKKRYQTKKEILDYCRRSANPVGRLLLCLTGHTNESQLKASDALCTALQLINFLNDIQSDYLERERCYMPIETLETMELSVETLYSATPSKKVDSFVDHQLNEIQSLLTESSSLSAQCPGRFGFYTEMVIQSAYQMLHKLRLRKKLNQPLRFNAWDWILIGFRSVVRRLKAW